MGRLNVLLFHSVLVNRGVERIILWLATRLNKDKYNVSVCILRENAPIVEKFSEQGVEIDVLGMKRYFELSALWKLYNLLKSKKIDILHIHGIRAAIYGRPIARLARVPVILYSVHNKWGGKLHFLLDRLTVPFGDGVFPFSNAVRSFLIDKERIPEKYIKQTIYIGIDIDRFVIEDKSPILEMRKSLGIPEDAPIIGSVGALTVQKGTRYLIEAMPEILKEFPELRYVAVGEGELRKELEELSRNVGVDRNVIFVGARNDIPILLNMFDVFVLPSLWEGLSQALIEAMASAKPAVATNVDGTLEVVEDGVSGILAPPRNPAALAKAIVGLLKDPQKMVEIGSTGRKRVGRYFSVRTMMKNFENLYDQLASDRHGS